MEVKDNKKIKQSFYRLNNILKTGAPYMILLGERSNGKSYAVKEHCITQAWLHDKKFIYLRRFDRDIKPSSVEQYFKDPPSYKIMEWTRGMCDGIVAFRGIIYLTKYNEELEKDEKVKAIGYSCALNLEQRYKSGSYEDVDNLIFEEFIAEDFYLPNEPTKLMNFISTVARRRRINVFMIGNTISRVCPYFNEWQLVNIPKQQQGTIDIYEHESMDLDENGEPLKIKMAVEFCENSGRNSKMFFGASSKMISTGAWQTKEVPHLQGNKQLDYVVMHRIVIKYKNFKFNCEFLLEKETGNVCWYVYPKTSDITNDERVITDTATSLNMLTTIGFIPLSASEKTALGYMFEGRIYYSDNLTGSDFEQCLKCLKLMN